MNNSRPDSVAPPQPINPHVRYLLFGWLGIAYGLFMGVDMCNGHMEFGIGMMFFAMTMTPVAAVVFQNMWIKKYGGFQ